MKQTTEHTLQIVLADDDKDDRFFFRELIDELDDDVRMTEFEDGELLTDFLNHVTEPPPPHMIFLDINMPRKTGIECLREIRSNKNYSKIPVIMFTTSSSARDIEDTFNCGANLFIRKAYSFKEGMKTLKTVFDDFRNNALVGVPRDHYFVG
jgi:CheY-like chemotaxis protein